MSTIGDQLSNLLIVYKRNKSVEAGKDLVKYIMKNKMGQHPELVLDFGIDVAQNNAYLLTDTTFAAFTEEFLIAALDLKQIDWC